MHVAENATFLLPATTVSTAGRTVGIAIGVLCGIAVMCVISFFLWRSYRARRQAYTVSRDPTIQRRQAYTVSGDPARQRRQAYTVSGDPTGLSVRLTR